MDKDFGRLFVMKFLPFAVLLLMSCKTCMSGSINFWEIQEELKNLNATCPLYDSCREARFNDDLKSHSCQCGAVCAQLGTCCVDSYYVAVRPPKVMPSCRFLGQAKSFFVVDRCPASDSKDSVWENLCQEEWNGEDDVLKLVPVTSLFTHITYKNYFCFRCHETTEDFVYWNLKLQNSEYPSSYVPDQNEVSLNYDSYYRSWMAPLGEDGASIPVNLSLTVPSEIRGLPIECEQHLISHCSEEWTDKDVSDKCEAYMGMVSTQKGSDNPASSGVKLKYRNVHCALCNFEDSSNLSCVEGSSFAFGVKVTFSFTHLLDINQSDGDKVGKIQRCEDNFLWDPYAKKCRKLTCALPGYVVKNGKCAPP